MGKYVEIKKGDHVILNEALLKKANGTGFKGFTNDEIRFFSKIFLVDLINEADNIIILQDLDDNNKKIGRYSLRYKGVVIWSKLDVRWEEFAK